MKLYKLFKSILEQDVAPVVVCDIDDIIVYMNPCAIKRYHKDLGAAKTSAYYSIAPFLGVMFSMVLLREKPEIQFYIAFVIMLVSTYFMVKDTIELQHTHEHEHIHTHEHSHGDKVHTHSHSHIHSHLHVHDGDSENHKHKHTLNEHNHAHSNIEVIP